MSLVAGEFSASYFQGTDQDPEIVNTAWKAGRLVPIFDLELGAGWQSPCGHFRVTAGYVVSMWFNTLTTDSWIRSVQQNNFVGQADAISYDTLTFDGFTARAEYRFYGSWTRPIPRPTASPWAGSGGGTSYGRRPS